MKFIPILFLAVIASKANAASLLFTSINVDEDGWAMVTLENLPSDTTVYFTDNEWNGSAIGSGGAFNTGESYTQWQSGAATIPAGTVIRFSSTDSATLLAASVGTFSRVTVSGSSNFGLSSAEDSLYAYLGTSATNPTSFLAAVSTTAFGTASAGVIDNTGLTIGNGAIQLGNTGDFAEYNSTRNDESSFASYASRISNIANWNNPGTDGPFTTTVPNTTAFSVVPEPTSVLLGSLGFLGLLRRRR